MFSDDAIVPVDGVAAVGDAADDKIGKVICGRTEEKVTEKVPSNFVKQGMIEDPEQLVKECTKLAKGKLFNKMKFVTEHSLAERMPQKIANYLGVPHEMRAPGGSWMSLWNKKVGNACRRAVNQRRNDISGSIRDKYLGTYLP